MTVVLWGQVWTADWERKAGTRRVAVCVFFGRFHIGELAVDAPLRFPVQSERSKVHANVSRYDFILHPYDDNDPKMSIIR